MPDIWRRISCQPDYKCNKEGDIAKVSSKRSRKPVKHGTGYIVVNLRGKTYRWHRLIAEAWLDNPESKPYVNHIDGDKTNNQASNLEWCTQEENERHSREVLGKDFKGWNNPACKHTERDVILMQQMRDEGIMIKDIAKHFDCDRNSVPRLIRFLEIGE